MAFDRLFKKSLIVAAITLILDFTFHYFFTNPMESLTYFVIKFLLAFFVATGLFTSQIFLKNIKTVKRKWIIFVAGVIFSTLMSLYYRTWEIFEGHVPFSSRAPDIIGISRTSILFPLIWWFGHAFFFIAGIMFARKIYGDK